MKPRAWQALFTVLLVLAAGSMGDGGPAYAATESTPASDSGLGNLSVMQTAATYVQSSADYAPAIWIPAASTNFTVANRPVDYPIDMIIIHDIEGSASSAIKAFEDPTRAGSAHYVVSYSGQVWQMVAEKDIAWHAGNWDYNTRAIGIEHEGFAYTPGLYTTAEYRASAHIAASICSRYGVTLDRAHVIGHYQVPDPYHPGLYGGAEHHTDPGPYWNWTYYLGYANAYAKLLPSPPHMMIEPVAVPDDQSLTVTWQPGRTCHNPIASYHVVVQPGNFAQDVAGNVTTATFAGLTNGTTYTATVTAINSDGQSSLDSNTVIAGPHCATAGLASDLTSPQLLGSQIHLTASSNVCPNATYQYLLQLANGRWSYARRSFGGPTWTWDTSLLTPGTYTLRVWADQSGDTSSGEASADLTFTLTEPPACTGAGLSPPSGTKPAGSTITFTASVTGCPMTIYEYWVQYPNGAWSMLRSFSTSPTWDWSTAGLSPGRYTVHVWANHPGGSLSALETVASSTVLLTGCTSASLAPSSGSSKVGTPVTFTASSSGCPNPVYEFWLEDTKGHWHLMRGFGSNTWTWNNAGWGKGTYHIHAWANQQGAYTGAFEKYGASTRTLT